MLEIKVYVLCRLSLVFIPQVFTECLPHHMLFKAGAEMKTPALLELTF